MLRGIISWTPAEKQLDYTACKCPQISNKLRLFVCVLHSLLNIQEIAYTQTHKAPLHTHTLSPTWHKSLRCHSETVFHTHWVQVSFTWVTSHSAWGELTLYPIFLQATDPSINPSPHTPVHPSTYHPNTWPSISQPSVQSALLPADRNHCSLYRVQQIHLTLWTHERMNEWMNEMQSNTTALYVCITWFIFWK